MEDKFDKLLNELLGEYNKDNKGELHEVSIRWEEGKEDELEFTKESHGEMGPKVDSYVLLYAAGKKLGEATGMDGKALGNDLVKAAMRLMIAGALKELEDVLK